MVRSYYLRVVSQGGQSIDAKSSQLARRFPNEDESPLTQQRLQNAIEPRGEIIQVKSQVLNSLSTEHSSLSTPSAVQLPRSGSNTVRKCDQVASSRWDARNR